MGRKANENPSRDPLDDADDDREVIDMVPVGSLPPPQPSGMPPPTEAERRTEDLWERLLGTDEVGTGYINVGRVMGAGNTSEDFVQKFPADQYAYEDLLEHLREVYGPGAYRIRLYVKNSRGNFVMRGNKLATIAKPISNAIPTIRESGRNGNDTTAILATFEAMQQRSQQQMEALIERIERRNAQPSRSPALEMAETMQAMMTAMAPMFAMLKSNSAPVPQTDPLDMLTKVLALQKQLQPPMQEPAGGGETNWLDVVKEGLKALPTVINARNDGVRRALPNPAPKPAQRRPLAPTFAPVAEPGPADPATWRAESGEEGVESDEGEMVPVDRTLGDRLHPLHDNLCDLLNAARSFDVKGEPEPDQVAQMMVDQMGEGQRPLFRQFLESRTLLKDLVAIHPDAIDSAEWLLDLRDSVIERLDLIEGINQGYDQGSSAHPAPDADDDAGLDRQEDRPPETA